MPRPPKTKRPIRRRQVPVRRKPVEQYDHKGKERVNNPPVTPATDREAGKKTYAYDPHLDPQLVWAGKAEHTSFEVHTVSLHVHERIDPRSIIEAVRKREEEDAYQQLSLFQTKAENPPLREAIEFYKQLKLNSEIITSSELKKKLAERIPAYKQTDVIELYPLKQSISQAANGNKMAAGTKDLIPRTTYHFEDNSGPLVIPHSVDAEKIQLKFG